MSHFAFLKEAWPAVYATAVNSERTASSDPRATCVFAKQSLELLVRWVFTYDAAVVLPYDESLAALIHEPTFKRVVGETIFTKAKVIVALGNRAVQFPRPVSQEDAIAAVRELFHACVWLATAYPLGGAFPVGLRFEVDILPRTGASTVSLGDLKRQDEAFSAGLKRLSDLVGTNQSLDAQIAAARAAVASAKSQANQTAADHDYSEDQTRDLFIDLLLKEAGWPLDKPEDREFEVEGMPNTANVGYVDYVLWGDDGKPLGLVEAKRTRRDARVGQRQAELYADCLQAKYGQRPIIFYSNGYDHWMWDDTAHPPRRVQGFFKKAELELAIQRRQIRKPLAAAHIDDGIVERPYQKRAIRKVSEAFERDKERKALLVMATGAGKTRTVIALADLLMRCNWVKRVLFLADRTALVNQAVNAFKRHLPSSSPVSLVTERDADGRVFVSTYPTIMNVIEQMHSGQRRFGVGHFDLVIIDEAHRSVFQKYRAIFDYFDSHLVGLTATPKNEVGRDTYGLFDLESGVPTDAYELEDAVRDGYLVPQKAVSVPTKFQRQGIAYDELSDEEKDQWDSLDWDGTGAVPDKVQSEALNRWLFNKDTADQLLAHLMTNGIKVEGGDRLGKTIIFAANQDHADFIQERFDVNYPEHKGEFARVITFRTEYAQSLIDAFSLKDDEPHIAVSVDMLDTGIDVPEVVNLVFWKVVRSKTKFWQMVGRGTRLCDNLFGPGQDKEHFLIFDYCQNLEFFSQNPEVVDSPASESLGKKLFKARLELIEQLASRDTEIVPITVPLAAEDIGGEISTEREVRILTARRLYQEVCEMSLENFVVRKSRRSVERFSKPEAWESLSAEDVEELAHQVAGLPSGLPAEDEFAKRFDLLILNLQLAVLRSEPSFERLRDQVMQIAGLLEEKTAIPMVKAQLPLIQDLQTEEWWQDVTVPMLEIVRRRIRDLVHLIDKERRQPVYTDFEDTVGTAEEVQLPGFAQANDFRKFRMKAESFLQTQKSHPAVHKLRTGVRLTAADVSALESLLVNNGLGANGEIEQAKTECQGLGAFIRSIVGFDRAAANEAFGEFLRSRNLNASQNDFINMIINQVVEQGALSPATLYESPFTDVAPHGPDGLFTAEQVERLVAILQDIQSSAMAA